MNMHLPYRPDLQGLRAIAVLMVVLAHAEVPPFSGGFVGVDVFFVLSGYLISGLLIREHEQSGRIAYLDFYTRRFKRLLPALLLMLCVSVLAAYWLLSANEARALLASAPYATSWTSNIYFAFSTYGYFEELAARDFFLHTWSLAVEEQFYLVWPVLVASFLGLLKASFGRESRWTGVVLLSVFVLATLLISVMWTRSSAIHAFYLMPARIWQFGLGALVYLIGVRQRCALSAVSEHVRSCDYKTARFSIVSWCGLALILGSAIAFDRTVVYPGLWALVPSVGAALVIGDDLSGSSFGTSRALAHPLMVWLGDRSYSIYLWHWPVLMLGLVLGLGNSPANKTLLILVTLLLSIISYRVVELPFWKGRLSHAPARIVPLAAVLVITLAFAASFHALRIESQQPASSRDIASRIRMDIPEIYRMPCDAWYHHARVEPCVFGPESASRTVVLLGDSIGVQWLSAIRGLFSAPEWRLVVLTKSSCAMVDEDYVYPRIGQVYHVCTEWRNKALDEIGSLKPDYVFVGSDARAPLNDTQWVAGSNRVLRRLSQAAEHVVVIGGTPSLSFDGPSCIARNLELSGTVLAGKCTEEAKAKQEQQVAGYLQQAAQGLDNVRVLDLSNLVCPSGVCAALTAEGVPVFRDSQHLTDHFVRSQTGGLRQMLYE